ncbi:MAG: dethiobiotin synthase [Leptospiraceae bacterium]|nr:dethiobiotin synthase [Leptospiraceae bacterium]MDW8305488.1 dethiobiotin synthase [Leptospiraceae bacterium]
MLDSSSYVIIGNHTGVGKTLISAILCQKLCVSYFKPIESGDPSDSARVRKLTSGIKVYPPLISFAEEEPPHELLKRYGKRLTITQICQNLPHDKLIVETAGGWYSPLNDEETMADLALALNFPVVLVFRPYLGAINHSFLTVEAISHTKLPIMGFFINGLDQWGLKDLVVRRYGLRCLGEIPELETISPKFVQEIAYKLWQ